MALHLLGEGNVLRVDPKTPDGLFALDKLNETELLGKAAHESRKLSDAFKDKFLGFDAPEFKPANQ